MQEPPPLDVLIASLDEFSRHVQTMLSKPGIDWHGSTQNGEWSLTEVVCHLRDVEDEVHQPRLKALIQENGVFLPGAVADAWVIEREYYKQDGPAALQDFLKARTETVQLVGGLDEEQLNRQGQHAFFGPTTMHELIYLMVQHDEAHMEQILDLLKE